MPRAYVRIRLNARRRPRTPPRGTAGPLHYEALSLLHPDLALCLGLPALIPYRTSVLFRVYSVSWRRGDALGEWSRRRWTEDRGGRAGLIESRGARVAPGRAAAAPIAARRPLSALGAHALAFLNMGTLTQGRRYDALAAGLVAAGAGAAPSPRGRCSSVATSLRAHGPQARSSCRTSAGPLGCSLRPCLCISHSRWAGL
jgi:hypothetical protein